MARRTLRETLKVSVLWFAKIIGGFALARRLTRRNARILCFHGAWLGEGHYSNFLFMSPGKFRSRLAFLQRAHFPVIPLERAVQDLASGTLPDCATVITIDDGWYGTYRHMVPELVARNLPATIYVTSYYADKQLPVFDVAVQYVVARAAQRTLDLRQVSPELEGRYQLDDPPQRREAVGKLIDRASRLNGAAGFELLKAVSQALDFELSDLLKRRVFHLMSADEIRQASGEGIDIQLHTHRHRLATEHPDVLAAELKDNRDFLEPLVSNRLRHFCYPSGAWSSSAWALLETAGVASATTTEQGLAQSRAPRFALPRLSDGEHVPAIEFEAEMCGFGELTRRARRVFAGRRSRFSDSRVARP